MIYSHSVETENQKDLKLNVKLWLKANGHDYAWLAENCYVSESTVRNWMARKAIPKAKEHIIRQLIAHRPVVMPPVPVPPPGGGSGITVRSETLITFKLDHEVRKKLEDKAFKQGLTLEEFLSASLSNLTAE